MSLDRWLFQLLHRGAGRHVLVDYPALALARHGASLEVALMLFVGLRHGSAGRRVVRRCLGAVGSIYAIAELLGRMVERRRPFAVESAAIALVPHASRRSFPSRHAASAVAMALITRRSAPAIGNAMGLLAIVLGLGRVRTGLHYPSDIAGGALVGALVGLVFRPDQPDGDCSLGATEIRR